MTKMSDQMADDLALIENCALHSIYQRDGGDAFDNASRKLLVSTAAVIATVRGRRKLHEIFEVIEEAQLRAALS